MNLAIDREGIAQQLFHGLAMPSVGLSYTPWNEALEPYPYDPDRATQLLAEAGYPDGFDLELWNVTWSGGADMTDVLFAVQGYWDTIGLGVEITPHNIMAIYGQLVAHDTGHACLGFATKKSLGPYGGGFIAAAYSQVTRFPIYESAASDAMIDNFQAANSQEERDAVVEQLVQYFYDEYAWVPIVAIDRTWATGDRIANWNPDGIHYLDLEYVTHADPLGTFRLFEP